MPIQTDLNVSPYYDDFDENKNFYKVLFKPGVAVQARELNQLQTILQSQIEKFGDNIYKRGTVIDGCDITFHPSIPYVKLKDIETDSTPVNVSTYKGLYVKNSANLQAVVIETTAGFETRSPDLNTLYVKYINSGSDFETETYTTGEVLTVFDQTNPIFKFRVNDGASSFSNLNAVIVTSAISVQNSSGGNNFPAGAFPVGSVINNGVANAVIIQANTYTPEGDGLILRIKPLSSDLLTANTEKWRLGLFDNIKSVTTANTARITRVYGTGTSGSLITDSLGKVVSITVTSRGSGYEVQPHVSIQSTTGASSSDVDQLDITAQNFLTNVTIPTTGTPIGVSYGVSVDEGVIYQKGYFSRVEQQLVIVEKYSNTNFDKSVGFMTTEDIIDSNIDQTLLDNATGTFNYTAPGADRLKLLPMLISLPKNEADANTFFFPIVEFSDGKPYKQNKQTVYNIIGDVIAQRTFEESGNYVLDQFNVVTKSPSAIADADTSFDIYVDPGVAYINGYRTETVTNYTESLDSGTSTANSSATFRIGFGNYISVNELYGVFDFSTGTTVDLYDTPAVYLSGGKGGTAISAVGTKIGSARIRSLKLDTGEAGTSAAVYRLYLFDIKMNQGKNFADIRSIHNNATPAGIADVVLENVSGKLIARLNTTDPSTLLYKAEVATKAISGIAYTYRTVAPATVSTNGVISIANGSNQVYPYSDSTFSKRDVIVVARQNFKASTQANGTIACNTTSPNVTGTATEFLSSYRAGDFILGGTSFVGQVSSVVNNSHIVLTANAAASLVGNNSFVYFPNNAPISLSRGNRSVSVVGGALTISLDTSIANVTGSSVSANVAVVYNSKISPVVQANKEVKRNLFARIRVANNTSAELSTVGPWALGVSDVFRLRGVYKASGASRDSTFNSNTDVNSTGDFINITNNPFANGDSITYITSGSAIAGLSNNTSYFVVSANNTSLKLSSTRGGSALGINASSLSQTHTLRGSPLYFGPTTFGVTDVTNYFYVDHNQNEDYLGTSYLVKKPTTGTSSTVGDINANDVLLVNFDCFTTTATLSNLKTVDSYPVNDGLNLSALANTSINTMEIPELFGNGDKYYDLRDQFDFRLVSSNTIPLTSDFGSDSVLNPSEPSDVNRFAAGDKYFPSPDTDLEAEIEYYVGRNDRIILDSRGNFKVIKGVEGNLNTFPKQPADTITLNLLRIPPYPSLPYSLSKDVADIIDTKVISNSKLSIRRNNFKISSPIDSKQRALLQVRNYKMSDIAGLERRIEIIERYLSFTLAEVIAQKRFIPSSGDAAVDRFKFGFFVDPFVNYNFSDLNDRQYYATIRDDQLFPKINELNLEFDYNTEDDLIGTSLGSIPFNEFTISQQLDATGGPFIIETISNNVTGNTVSNTVITTPTPTPTPTPGPGTPVSGVVTVTTVTQSTLIQEGRNRSDSRDKTNNDGIFEDWAFTMSSLPGPVKMYVNSKDSWTKIFIYQGTTPNFTLTTPLVTTSSAQAMSATDASSTGEAANLGSPLKLDNVGSLTVKDKGYLKDTYKIIWNHDPLKGRYYVIRVYKGQSDGKLERGFYAYRIYYPSDATTSSVKTVSNPQNFLYSGTVFDIQPSLFEIQLSSDQYANYFGTTIVIPGYVADSQRFKISATGLKPKTRHKFFFADQDKTTDCSQIFSSTSGTGTTGLVSDENGVIVFDFFYDAGINEATTDLTQQNKLATSSSGVKKFSIRNSDATSGANGTIEIKYYNKSSTATSSLATTGTTGSQTTGMTSTQTITSTTVSSTYPSGYDFTISEFDIWG